MRNAFITLVALTLLCGVACASAGERAATSAPTAAAEVSATPAASETPTPASTATASVVPQTQPPQQTATPQPTPSALPTQTPSPTPTSTPTVDLFGGFAPPDPAAPTPEMAYPTPAPLIEKCVAPCNSAEIVNILLLGNDRDGTRGRTDTIIIASLNTRLKTATLLSVPRDLYVYIPGWQMERINLAAPHSGVPLLKETLRYNLGVEIDYYVRVGFDGFQAIVDALDGVHIAVICPLEDWRLRSPELDPTVEENYERFRLDANWHAMDGDLALWYARSRRSTSDFDRGRRQQQLIAAMLDKALRRDALRDVPALWSAFQGMVETDLPVAQMVQLAAIGSAVQENGVRHLALAQDALAEVLVGEARSSVQRLEWAAAERVLRGLYAAPALGRASRSPLTVAVEVENWIDYRLSAENLLWQDFIPEYRQSLADQTRPVHTTIHYHGPNFKGSYDWLISWIFHNAPVQLATDPDATHDYRVVLGEDFNPCRSPLYAP